MDLEQRQDRLEDRFSELEHRQYSFEKAMEKGMAEFKTEVRMYMKNNDATIAEMKERMNRADERMNRADERMDRLDTKIDTISNQIHNMTLTTAVGVAAIVVTILLTRG